MHSVTRVKVTPVSQVEYRRIGELGSFQAAGDTLGDCPWAGCDRWDI